MEYLPQLVNRVSKLSWTEKESGQLLFTLTHLSLKGSAIRPRYGCVCWPKDDKNVFIFGGIFNDINDFLCLPPGLTRMQITNSNVEFKHEQKPISGDRMRPKMFYAIMPNTANTNSIMVYGGFGRDFTNMFSLFSCFYY